MKNEIYIITLPEYGHLLPILTFVKQQNVSNNIHLLVPTGFQKKVFEITQKTFPELPIFVETLESGGYKEPQTFQLYTVFSHFYSTLSFALASKKFLASLGHKENTTVIIDAILEYLLDRNFLRQFSDVQIFHAIMPLRLRTFLRYRVPLRRIFGPIHRVPKESMKMIRHFWRVNKNQKVKVHLRNFHKRFLLPRSMFMTKKLSNNIQFPKKSHIKILRATLARDEYIPDDLKKFTQQHGRVVYVSFGTVFARKIESYLKLLSLLPPQEAVVISCKPEQREVLAKVLQTRPRTYIGTQLPQLYILRNTKLFVTHAGFNSINEAMYFSVPMLLMPNMYEQELNAKMVVSLQCGLILKENASQVNVDRVITKLLEK